MDFPDLINSDWNADKQKKAKELIDYAIDTHIHSSMREMYQRRYDRYNGIIDEEKLKPILKKYIDKSKTPFITHNIGRPKIKRLLGEFLRIGIKPTVYTYNYDATQKKRKELALKRGRAVMAETINGMRQNGIDPYDGAEMPSLDEPGLFDESNYKTVNERCMQKIINHKITKEAYRLKFKTCLVELILHSEFYVRFYRDEMGLDQFEVVNLKHALKPDLEYHMDSEYLPYCGAKRLMTLQQVLSIKGLSEAEKKTIRKEFEDGNNEAEDEGSKEEIKAASSGIHKNDEYGFVKNSDGQMARWVYIVEWKSFDDPVFFKEENGYTREIKKADIAKAKRKGLEVIEKYRKVKYRGYRMGADTYFGIGPVYDCAHAENALGKNEPLYDYKHFKLEEIDGMSVSLYDIISKIEEQWDLLRWYLNREIRKIKGSAGVIDEAFQSKSFTKMLYEISEEGVTTINSQSDKNIMAREGSIGDVIGKIDFGNSTIITDIINLGADTERILDMLTGFNDARQGLEKATSTATTNQNNLESSRSATYDLFDFMDFAMNSIFSHMCNQVKLNKDYIENVARGAILTDQESKFLEDTTDMMLDSFGAVVSNSKKEMTIRSAIEMFIPQEINAGKLSSVDYAKYAMKDTLSEAIEVLDKGRKRIEGIESQIEQQKNETKMQEIQSKEKIATDNREDLQAHELEKEMLSKNLELRNTMMQENIRGSVAQKREEEVTRRDLAVAKLNKSIKEKSKK